MPAEVEKVARKQLDASNRWRSVRRVHRHRAPTSSGSSSCPGRSGPQDRLDLDEAREILDADHYGLEKVKKRILEYLAVRKLEPGKKGPILCLVGPPGVGKTSLGKSIARALGREFVRISLGGVRDEAEIRGHRRTYIGALPGRIIQGMQARGRATRSSCSTRSTSSARTSAATRRRRCSRCSTPSRTPPSRDHYLEVPFDLSEVLFIATANMLDPIPPALLRPHGGHRDPRLHARGEARDRQAPPGARSSSPSTGSTDEPRSSSPTRRSTTIIEHYTREAGVRNLEREMASVDPRRRGQGRRETCRTIRTSTPRRSPTYLGPQKFYSEAAERTEIPGVATGLAWTPTGGDILFIEATRMPGKGSLILTGQLGDVMKESARAALSYVRTHARISASRSTSREDRHALHVPAGAVPKDGPSAGVTIGRARSRCSPAGACAATWR